MVPFALLSRHLIREVYAASGDSAGIRGGATDGVGELGSVVVQPLASSIGITISPARLPLGTHSRAAVLVGTPECCEQQVRQRRRQTWRIYRPTDLKRQAMAKSNAETQKDNAPRSKPCWTESAPRSTR